MKMIKAVIRNALAFLTSNGSDLWNFNRQRQTVVNLALVLGPHPGCTEVYLQSTASSENSWTIKLRCRGFSDKIGDFIVCMNQTSAWCWDNSLGMQRDQRSSDLVDDKGPNTILKECPEKTRLGKNRESLPGDIFHFSLVLLVLVLHDFSTG